MSNLEEVVKKIGTQQSKYSS